MKRRLYDIQLIINNKSVDLPKDFDLNLNAKVYNPTTILSKTAEYSYTFSLPTTKKNCQVLDYANVLSVPNKFIRNYDAELTIDGMQTFKGSLRITEINKKEFKCNLIVVKVNTIEDIFGDDTFASLNWEVPFDGISTINSVNNSDYKYWFPLVSYGVFAKYPVETFETYNNYTSIYSIDYTTKLYNSTFYPSLNMVELMRRCFAYKGYVLEGDILTNDNLNNIYMSTHLASNQQPIYNLGNERFGKVSLSTEFKNCYLYIRNRERTAPVKIGSVVPLDYPYDKYSDTDYNFDEVSVYNILKTSPPRTSIGTSERNSMNIDPAVTINEDTFLFNKGDGFITIPSDGLYRITLKVDAWAIDGATDVKGVNIVPDFATGMNVRQYYSNRTRTDETEEKGENVRVDTSDYSKWREYRPIEIQLVKNYEDKVELIKGCVSFGHGGLNPTSNTVNYVTAFPHEENMPLVDYPTTKVTGSATDLNDSSWYMPRYTASATHGVSQSEMIMYDPMVNPNFICGFSTIGNCASVIKNGYSWYRGDISVNDVMVDTSGYTRYYYDDNEVLQTEMSDYQKNSTNSITTNNVATTENGTQIDGTINCMVYLNKNDKIYLLALTRSYDEMKGTDRASASRNYSLGTYPISVNCDLTIQAITPSHSEEFKSNGGNFYSNPEFSDKLNLASFLNKDMKISDFIKDIQKSFNLSFQQEGVNVMMDSQKKNDYGNYAVNIDDRVNADTAEYSMSKIDYPSSFVVKYNINTAEAGFYNTVPRDKINRDDWEQYGNYGYDEIKLDESGDENKTEETLKNSYCWYEPFTIHEWLVEERTDPRSEQTYTAVTNTSVTQTEVMIPVIAESQYFIDRGDIESYMVKDGYSLPYRFWYRNHNLVKTLKTVYDMDGEQEVDIYVPTNIYNGIKLSYKTTENNILKQYFNLSLDLASNSIEIECFIDGIEYQAMKNGCNVILDDDVYRVLEISKYNISKKNPTTLKLMKL